MRKFDAIHNNPSSLSGAKGGQRMKDGNPLLASAKGGNKVTTDHNGNIIQIRSGAIALQ